MELNWGIDSIEHHAFNLETFRTLPLDSGDDGGAAGL